MPRWVRAATLFGLLLLALPSAALAKCFGVGNTTLPHLITVVGSLQGIADAIGRYTFIPKDLANNPCYNDEVEIDFSNCPGVHILTNPTDCSRSYTGVHATITSADGSVTFTIVGCSNGLAPSAETPPHCAIVRVNGVQFGTATVAVLDLDGRNGVGANDLSIWLADYGTGHYVARGDYDGDGALTANDLSLWITTLGAGHSSEGWQGMVSAGNTLCP